MGADTPGGLPSKLVLAVADAVSAFGAAVKPRLASPVGEPEDQMRGPLENAVAVSAPNRPLTVRHESRTPMDPALA